MNDARLVIFDVDGTLVDSAGHICAAMEGAYARLGLPCPPRARILSIVGLSLPQAMAALSPELDGAAHAALTGGYRDSYADLRRRVGAAESSPLYPGTRAMLDALAARPGTLLAVATGKSRRGMDHLIAGHGLEGMFASVQTADFHPSKPHPAMIHACLEETGIAPAQAVLIGDTTYDIEMARAAGVAALGVTWGNHAPDALRAAGAEILPGWEALPGWLAQWEGALA